MATTSTAQFCSECNKCFKNLRLHIVKAHDKIVVEIPDLSWCAAADAGDWVVPRVKYNGLLCEESDGWAELKGGDYTQLYEFPQEIIDQNKNKYFGIHITFSPSGRVVSAAYRKEWPYPNGKQEEPIAASRVTTVTHF